MSVITPAAVVPTAFVLARAELEMFPWSPDLEVMALEAPRTIAPYAEAVGAEISDEHAVQGCGKLILLHDPAGQAAWDGDFRCVTYANADIDQETFYDQFRAEVGWSWLIDALASHDATARAISGTVTVSASTHFGGRDPRPASAEIELRASWTPDLRRGVGLTAHLAAWQDLLRMVTGLPPQTASIIPLARAGRR